MSENASLRNLYRNSKFSEALVQALGPLVESGQLPPELALRILDQVCACVASADRCMDESVSLIGSCSIVVDGPPLTLTCCSST